MLSNTQREQFLNRLRQIQAIELGLVDTSVKSIIQDRIQLMYDKYPTYDEFIYSDDGTDFNYTLYLVQNDEGLDANIKDEIEDMLIEILTVYKNDIHI
jgi:hypothetical protein